MVFNQDLLCWGLRFGATFTAVMGFGHCVYISVVEVAARRRLKTGEAMVDHFQATFPLAKVYSQALGAFPTLMSVAHYFLNPGHPSSKLLLAAGLFILTIGPYTVFFILPTNNQLLDGDNPKKKPQSWIESKMDDWARLHSVRTLIFGLDSLAFMYALTK